ncbi:MAG: sulfatase-like hydrolase/transferase [Patescibacteria group bacterium]
MSKIKHHQINFARSLRLGIYVGVALFLGSLLVQILHLHAVLSTEHKILESLFLDIFVLKGLSIYLIFLVGLHVVFGLLLGLFFFPVSQLCGSVGIAYQKCAVLFFTNAIICLLLFHTYWYPLSIFSRLFSEWSVPNAFLFGQFFLTALVVILSLLFYTKYFFRQWQHTKLAYDAPLLVLSIVFITSFLTVFVDVRGDTKATFDHTNIILIGVDSLRPDYVTEPALSKGLPNLYSFFDQSIFFENAYTPLARTSPAWVSVLTGMQPKNSRMRFNLMPHETIQRPLPFLSQLQTAGYNTTFVSDDRRFNNIDEEFGFTTVIGPETGIADFLFGTLHDAPLPNLLSPTVVNDFLPYVRNNRAIYHSYDPYRIIKDLQRHVRKTGNSSQFLANHLTLVHWPYLWKDIINDVENSNLVTHSELYNTSLKAADRQFGKLWSVLEHEGLLEDALVFVFSDHGQALEEERGVVAASANREQFTMSVAGHGTNIFSEEQYKVVLGMQRYLQGEPQWQPRTNSNPVSLIDIKPTIIEELGLDFDTSATGFSLKELDNGALERMLFLESGFNRTNELTGENFHIRDALQSAKYYAWDQSGTISIRREYIPELLRYKQRGVRYRDWIVGYIPTAPEKGDWYIVDSSTQTWFSPHSFSDEELFERLKAAVCEEYRDDAGFPYLAACAVGTK